MLSDKQTDWHPENPETALTLPSKYYFDQDIFDREAETIYFPSWHFVCHRSEIENPGDFIKFDLLEQSVLVVRGEDGAVHAYHNVCQHRGARLIEERRGTIKKLIVCPYHAWSYALDGCLRNAPRTENLQDFDRSKISLKAVRVEELAGFYFINMDPDAPALADQMAGAEAEMRLFLPDLDDIALVNEVDYVIDANWKVVIDNAIEGYHFELSGPVHREFTTLIDFSKFTLQENGFWWDQKGPCKPVEKAFGHNVAGKKGQPDWFYGIQLWPMTTLFAIPHADVITTFNQIPLGPEKTLLRMGHYCPTSRPQSALSDAAIKWFNTEIGPEDIELNLAVQRGIRSFGFDQGRYLIDPERGPNSEHLLHHFHKLVYGALKGPRTPSVRAVK